ncbi:hypothetical protein PG984_016394 [Apiospora sp. TS-2023a]
MAAASACSRAAGTLWDHGAGRARVIGDAALGDGVQDPVVHVEILDVGVGPDRVVQGSATG